MSVCFYSVYSVGLSPLNIMIFVGIGGFIRGYFLLIHWRHQALFIFGLLSNMVWFHFLRL